MDRIDNVDLREALQDIAQNNTFFHRDNDINISFNQMERASMMIDPTEKTLIWVSYPSGIDCYSERDVFQKDTRAFNGVNYHGTEVQSDRRLAYAVEVTARHDGKILGNLYEIDIREYAAHIRKNAVTSDTIRLYLKDTHDIREHGSSQIVMPKAEFNEKYPRGLPQMNYYRPEPRDPAALQSLLDAAAKDREAASTPRADLWSHTTRLYDERYAFYAAQTVREIDKLQKPNSPDNQTFTVRLNAYIATAFGNNELGKLLDALPYKTAALTVQKGQPDMRVVVPRDEVLQHRRGQERQDAPGHKPSILGQLADAQKEAAARQATPQNNAHKKRDNLEV